MRILGTLFLLLGLLMAGAEKLKESTIVVENPTDFWMIPVGLILAVIGLICIAAGGSRKVEIVQGSVSPPQAIKTGDTKICPACAEEVKKEAKICRFCSHSFSAPALPPTPSYSAPNKTMDQNQYFFQIAGGVHQGPVGPDEIGRLIQNKKLGPDDQIRIPQQGWHKVSDINFS